MHGQNESSYLTRWIATLVQALAIALAGWILLRDGSLSLQDGLVLGGSIIYWMRTTFGLFVLLKRRFAWVEGVLVSSLFASFHIGFAWLSTIYQQTTPLLLLGAGLYLLGSYLNTGSEWARFVWKKDPAHKGKLYDQGLFRYSMHINYFGDSVLFTGFAMLTGSPWAYLWPALMTTGFVFQHIPELDAYLAQRYGQQFETYAARTKKLIPFVY